MGVRATDYSDWLGHGMRTVVSGGTPNALTTSATPAKRFMVKAKAANAAVIYLGNVSTMTTTLDAGNVTCGLELSPGEWSPWLPAPSGDLANVYIDGTTDDDVFFIWE